MLCKHLKFLGELIKDSVPYENVYNSKLCSLFSSFYTFSSFAWQSLETSASASTMFVFSCNPSFFLHLSFDSSSCFVCLFIHLIVFVFSLCSCIIIRRNPHRKKLSPAISLEVVCVCVCPDVPMETTKMQTPNFLVNFPKLFKSHAHIHFTLLRTPWISLFMFFILFLFLHSFENWQIFIAKTNNNNTFRCHHYIQLWLCTRKFFLLQCEKHFWLKFLCLLFVSGFKWSNKLKFADLTKSNSAKWFG